MADISKIIARLDKIDAELDTLRAGVLTSAVNVQTANAEAIADLGKMLTGSAALIRRGDERWFVTGGKRRNIASLSIDEQREIKDHFGVERSSTEASDDVWAVIVALTDEV